MRKSHSQATAVEDPHLGELRLGEASIFRNLSADEIDVMLAIGQRSEATAEQTLIREGDLSPNLLVVLSGKLRIEKCHTEDKRTYTIAHVSPGSLAGEFGLLRPNSKVHSRAMATVITQEPTTYLQIPLELIESRPEFASFRTQLILNTARVLADKLGTTSEDVVERLRATMERQKLFARYMVSVVGIFSLFSVSIYALQERQHRLQTAGLPTESYQWLHSIGITLLLFTGFFYSIRSSGLDLKSLGCVKSGWLRNAMIGLAFSAPAIAAMAVVRVSLYPADTWYTPYALIRAPTMSVLSELASLFFYLGPIVWMQEFVTRIGLQAVIQDMLPEQPRRGALIAVLISAIGFGALHTYYGLAAVLVTTLAGLYWGLAFYLRRSLIMAGTMHMICGFMAFYWFGLLR